MPHPQRLAGEILRQTVVDLTDLALLGKQAYWNVIGPRSPLVRLGLDEMIRAARVFIESAAERATSIGVSPDVRARTLVERSCLTPLPAGRHRDGDVVQAMVCTLAGVVRRLRQRIDAAAADPITRKLMIDITAAMEQSHRVWQAQSA
ncbi:DNA starvation/stationary phase protection protein [Nocardia blacklockiae]|nr:DNA starvation/stationary phase protection protein [Nocardia blacklockiae]